jgi:TRAP-type mannitol/chloroaromatic compound transport system substrate-binding protein
VQIETACQANIAMMLAEGEAIQFSAMAELQEKGVTLHRWSPEILSDLETAWTDVAAELAAEDATFKQVWDSFTAYRAGYKVWKELGYLN